MTDRQCENWAQSDGVTVETAGSNRRFGPRNEKPSMQSAFFSSFAQPGFALEAFFNIQSQTTEACSTTELNQFSECTALRIKQFTTCS
jgi:hypothetical protein